ncbi:MAG: glycosyltransferase family 39 protein [Candidatus Beckwithbacteria bacterium]|nr:glycosyltransferase family 39 protein [Candidatus Beckwithbacteria bacterium]
MKFLKKEKLVILLLIVLGFLFRWYLIRDNYFEFYYYQARDADVSRSILEKADLKIQGPATSGTNDKIYNGVLYYYLTGPIYTLFKGNPLAPTLFLSFLSSLAVVPIYLIGKEIFKSRNVGIAAALLYAFSVDASQLGTWLGNSSIATWSVPFFYFFLWQSLFKKKKKFLALTALFLGLANQATLYTAYLIGIVVMVYIFQAIKEKNFWFLGGKNFFKAIAIYLMVVSPMILTQIKLLLAGVYKLNQLSTNAGGKPTFYELIRGISGVYVNKAEMTLLPSIPKVSLMLVFLIIFWFLIRKDSRAKKIFISLWLFTPALLFLILGRASYYSITGLNSGIYLIVAWIFYQGFKKTLPNMLRVATTVGIIIFIASNFNAVQKIRETQANNLTVQSGAFLNRLLEVVDYTYKAAGGKQFSISALTNPYKYSTTWAYLYSWYGREHYGYLPKFVGSDQKGIPAGDLLENIKTPEKIHFSIYETDPGGLAMFVPEFRKWQEEIAGPASAKLKFGSISLEQRGVNKFMVPK